MNKTFKKILVVLLFVFVSFSFYFYQIFFTPNIHKDLEFAYVQITSKDDFDAVANKFYNQKIVDDIISFRFVAKLLKYNEKIVPGKFKVVKGMTNLDIVRMLRNGNKTTVRFTFNNFRLKNQIAQAASQELEFEEEELNSILNDDRHLEQFGFNSENIAAMFIPNTYEFYWSTPADEFMKKMHKEYVKFWNPFRLNKAKNIGLSPIEVSILASIVEEEQKKFADERPRIAGVYLNRLKYDRLLQADPTVKFALGDFNLKRVEDLSVDSPYNTYKYKGLPPGPICIPSIASIDAVLNPEEHKYLYFCARPDGSGYHDFSESFEAHKLKAIKYRQTQNKKK